MLGGAAARVAVIVLPFGASTDPALLPDEVQYWNMAVGLADGAGLQDELGFRAARMPLYPALLAVCAHQANGRRTALVMQALLGALSCGFAAVLAARVAPAHLRRVVAAVAGGLVALDPFLVYFHRFLLTENLFTAALCGFVLLSWPLLCPERTPGLFRWLGAGAAAAGCVYLRPATVGLLVCWSGLLCCCRGGRPATWAGLACSWLVVVVALVPWAARNQRVTGRWTWLTNRAGISLYDGVRPGADGGSDLGAIKRAPEVAGLDEVAWNAYFQARSRELLVQDPLRIVTLAGRKLLRTWSPWPNAADYQQVWIRILAGTWTAAVLITAAIGFAVLWRRHRAAALLLILPALYVTGLHLLFVGSVRYRLPVMPPLEVLSAIGVGVLLCRGRGRNPVDPAVES